MHFGVHLYAFNELLLKAYFSRCTQSDGGAEVVWSNGVKRSHLNVGIGELGEKFVRKLHQRDIFVKIDFVHTVWKFQPIERRKYIDAHTIFNEEILQIVK